MRGANMDIKDNELIKEIKYAIEHRELKAYYQPQYDSITNRLVSAEALVRWIKNDGTMVMPGEFIPELEKSDAIIDVDWYMLEEVCRLLNRQEKESVHRVPIAVNFSRMHILYEDDLVERLCNIADRYQIPHSYIEIEITESAFVDKSREIANLVRDVRKEGFAVAIDDFGSGVSSLSFVKEVEVDVLKIDKSLLSHNCEDEKERIVLESIFSFAHRLKLITVAEGVETREQLGFLRTCSCKKIQGFLFSKPISEEKYIEACHTQTKTCEMEDILMTQAPSSATQLLLEAIFTKYPLVIFSNLTRNSFYMMAYENFSSTSCPSTGVFDELIAHGASTMHPEDQEAFKTTFSIENQMAAYNRGEKYVKLITRQIGNDGVYRRVETTNFFVKNQSVDDLLVISLCDNLDE
jgi:EAL domain-containing protein (putative c-di-GMP-specific phosphodiesterase class I)